MPALIGAAALVLLIAGGGIWIAMRGGSETPEGGGETFPIADPGAGTPIVAPTPVVEAPSTDPDPTPPAADPEAEFRAAIQVASEAVEQQDWAAAKAAYEKALGFQENNEAAQGGLARATRELTAHEAFQAGKDFIADEQWIKAVASFDSVPEGSLLENDAQTQSAYARKHAGGAMKARIEAAMAIHDYQGAGDVAQAWLDFEPKSRAARRAVDRAHEAERKASRPAPVAVVKRPPHRREPPPPKNTAKVEEAKAAQSKGIQIFKKGDYELAAKQLERAIRLDPAGQRETHKLLGIAYAKQRKMDLAAKHYRLYVKKNPSAPDAGKIRGILSRYEASKGG